MRTILLSGAAEKPPGKYRFARDQKGMGTLFPTTLWEDKMAGDRVTIQGQEFVLGEEILVEYELKE